MTDTILMGLRLLDGLDLAAFARRFGTSLESVYTGELARLTDLVLVAITGGRLRLTRRGLPLANEVFPAFV
jgi:oxygen-independent coproporphyrinogen-3 oxidase